MAGVWSTNGLQTNPTTNFVLADTGTGWGAGATNVTFLISSTVAVNVAVESYDGGGPTASHSLAISANVPFTFSVLNVQIPPGSVGLRLRVITGVTGSVQGSIFHS